VNQQTLALDNSHDPVQTFKQNLTMLTSKGEIQRRDALTQITNSLPSFSKGNPVGTPNMLAKLLPLTSDTSGPVRQLLTKLLRGLEPAEVKPNVEKIMMYIRVGLTHLSTDIRSDALDMLEWLLDTAAKEVVVCPGGWMKTLATFGALLGWKKAENPQDDVGTSNSQSNGWTTVSTAAMSATKGGALRPRQIKVLAKFLEAGLKPNPPIPWHPRQYWDNLYCLPKGRPDPFGYLQLPWMPQRDEDGDVYFDRHSRQQVFGKRWLGTMTRGVDLAKKEGGAVGRAAADLDRVLVEYMKDYESKQAS
jgi:pre-rRNA-processing protein IPI1